MRKRNITRIILVISILSIIFPANVKAELVVTALPKQDQVVASLPLFNNSSTTVSGYKSGTGVYVNYNVRVTDTS